MARAEYFDRAVQAAFYIINDFDQKAFLEKVDAHRVALAFDAKALTWEGMAAMDMSIRLAARFYPSMAIVPLDRQSRGAATRLKKLAREINPKITIASGFSRVTDVIVVGGTAPDADDAFKYYIGSDGWISEFSRSAPVGTGTSDNGLGAGVAACLGAANIFRRIFSDQKLDDELAFSVLDLDIAAAEPRNPVLDKVDIGDAYLVGAGAIGNGFLWGLFAYTGLAGKLTVIDHENVELFNIQRYALTKRESEGAAKVDVAKDFLLQREALQVTKFHGTWENFLNGRGAEWSFERVVSALDSAKDRIELQASLPKWIVNGWTKDTDIGVSHHDFIHDACLACLYMPDREVQSEDRLIMEALGLPPQIFEQDVRAKLELGTPLDIEYLGRIAEYKGIDQALLLQFEGKTLRELYTKAVCSGAVMELATGHKTARAEVPMPFQSALAGILQAVILIAHAAGERNLFGVTSIDLMKPFIGARIETSSDQAKRSICFCNDADYQQAYNEKYL